VSQLSVSVQDRHWLTEAIRLSRFCLPSATAFSVGAILVAADGRVLGQGFSRERDLAEHAEEVALARAGALAVGLSGATLYCSLEPCAARASRPVACADLIIEACIGRVVIAWREPPIFVPGGGAARLHKAGIAVVVLPELAAEAKAVNAHLLALCADGARLPGAHGGARPRTAGARRRQLRAWRRNRA
jgi:diaminohydroxyphosphoribosylaminopyrimidine deaminase / 5-amino-6-(5-phosphoribosylamino)uracil reductase